MRSAFQFTRLIRTARRLRPLPSLDAQLAGYDKETQQAALKGLQEHLQERAKSEEDPCQLDESLLLNRLSLAGPGGELDAHFWGLCRIFCAHADPRKYTRTFVALFERAKQIDDGALRMRQLHAIGRALYAPRSVRLDPLNEVEFLDALCTQNRAFAALKLWRGRLGREDVRELEWYWREVGALYCLQAGLYAPAHRLAREIRDAYDYVPPRLLVALITFQCRQNRPHRAYIGEWLQQLTAREPAASPTPAIVGEDAASVNQVDVTHDDYALVLRALMQANLWDLAAQVYAAGRYSRVQMDPAVLKGALVASAAQAKPGDGFLAFYEQLESSLAAAPGVVGRLALAAVLESDISEDVVADLGLPSLPAEYWPAITVRMAEKVPSSEWPLSAPVLAEVVRNVPRRASYSVSESASRRVPRQVSRRAPYRVSHRASHRASHRVPREQAEKYAQRYFASGEDLPAARALCTLVLDGYVGLEQAAEWDTASLALWKCVWYRAYREQADAALLRQLLARTTELGIVPTPQLALYMITAMSRVGRGGEALALARRHGFKMSRRQFRALRRGAELAAPVCEPRSVAAAASCADERSVTRWLAARDDRRASLQR